MRDQNTQGVHALVLLVQMTILVRFRRRMLLFPPAPGISLLFMGQGSKTGPGHE